MLSCVEHLAAKEVSVVGGSRIAQLLVALAVLSACGPDEPAPEHVTMTTTAGVIEIEVYTDRAPLTLSLIHI